MARAGLDRARIIAVAADMADEVGLAQVTFVKLAAELKVKPPSLYNHVESMAALMDELAMRALAGLLDLARGAVMGRVGWDALEALAHSQRAYAKAHPGLFTATFRSLHGRGERAERIANAYLGVYLAVLRSYGIEGAHALHKIRCLRAAIGGFIELELRGGFGLSLNVDESFQQLLKMLAVGIEH
jgi:AcrR family transcriptional regulator